ncbi:Arf GTPase activating protein [Quillaja saponaria]|uniref:Arf GTPase activating protein n=1 Tax=Quillaja saponaria TaxID=32244 RepID=A0AAD7Q7Z2_QUISA|nr:Arf GTPase activating protein [Quillaja saponaria]
MGSRKEEERNEKIIRGLMKLPPNRKCINCNSLGPQYVCTNFWTFICMTCSGIHREFTHRVKSVSMAKFTLQDVEALQNGGNQRAREIYLKDWDFQKQRLPDNSNVNKIREFIRNVYVDRRYAGGKASSKPPRDMQSPRTLDDETRRASSYHSYSQSPPYDYQYEERRYGKPGAVLTRKPGSDKGSYEGKMSSFIYSPGCFSDHASEDRFANDGTGSIVSDYSTSSGGEPFKSDIHSTNQPSRARSSEDVWSQTRKPFSETCVSRDADRIPHPQRTASSGSFGSMDSNSLSFKSYNSGGLVDFFSELEQPSGSLQDKLSTVPQPSGPAISVSWDLSNAPVAQEPASSASSVDLFQLQASPQASSVDLFQPSLFPSATSTLVNQPSQTSQSSVVDFFADISQQQLAVTLDNKSPELSIPKNEGWATFDRPPPTTSTAYVENPPEVLNSNRFLSEKFDNPQTTTYTAYMENPAEVLTSNGFLSENSVPFASLNSSMQWPSFEASNVDGPSTIITSPWHDVLHNEQASAMSTNTQAWNAFEDSSGHLPVEAINHGVQVQNLSSTDGQYLGLRASEDTDKVGVENNDSNGGVPDNSMPSDVVSGPSYRPSVLPLMGETQVHAINQKSSNPFDLPYDSDSEKNDLFIDMSSLQAALPNVQLPSPVHDAVALPWFSQNPVAPYVPAAGQGGLTYMAAQPTISQMPTVHPQGPVASIGGNPFA